MSTADSYMLTMDGCNAHTDHISFASKVHLQVILDAHNLQQENRTKLYIVYYLFGYIGPLIEALEMEVINHIDFNCSIFKR